MFRTSGDTSIKRLLPFSKLIFKEIDQITTLFPTGPAASPLKWCKIQLYKAQKVKYEIDSIFWQGFRAPRDLSIAGWRKKTKMRVNLLLLYTLRSPKNKKPFPSPFS